MSHTLVVLLHVRNITNGVMDSDPRDLPRKTRFKKCVSPALIDWNEPVEPKYKLDSTKFLIPALIWGPMNQGMTSKPPFIFVYLYVFDICVKISVQANCLHILRRRLEIIANNHVFLKSKSLHYRTLKSEIHQ